MNLRFRSAFITLALCSLLPSCNSATPENYFDEAVLNVNLITPFGGQAALYSLAHPSVKLVPGTKDQTTPMTRKEIVDELGKAYAAKHHIKVEWQTRNF